MKIDRMTKAFFELCKDEDMVDQISEQIEDLKLILDQNHFWITLMDSPMLTLKEKIKLIDELAFDVRLLSFVKVLADYHVVHMYAQMYHEWHNQMRIYQNIAHIRVISAKKLTKKQEEALIRVLQPRFKNKTVSLRVTLDETLIGGMVTVYKGQSLDQSIARELEELFITI